jgi:hypothetical protein
MTGGFLDEQDPALLGKGAHAHVHLWRHGTDLRTYRHHQLGR